MIKCVRLFSLLILLFIGMGRVQAQSRSELEDIAYDHLNNYEYAKAFDAFDKLSARYPKEVDYRFKLGICALGCPDKKARAIDIFKQINKESSTRESQYYLAKAYHINYKFDEAIGVLKPMIDAMANSKRKDDIAFVHDANMVLSNCYNGKVMLNNAFSTATVKNLGFPINSKEIEGVPIITADESMMIFTYQGRRSMGGKQNAALESDPNGTYLSDIYMSQRNPDSTWKSPVPVKSLNTRANDAAIAMSPDGMTLYTFFSSNENEGDIMVSRFNGTDFSKPEPLNSNINHPDFWEGSCTISADGKTLFFASERPNGLGGRDIWMSELEDGEWGPAKNLGPNVNTIYDDDAPFIHPDGVTLYYSSKGHSSIGGYDIMFSVLEKGEWSESRNVGLPLNTTEDDRFYVLNSKGDRGYFSSDRASTDSKGGQDIYLVLPGDMGEKLIVAMFKGVVYGDNKPIEAKIEVTRTEDNEVTGPFASNGLTGKYLLTLKPGFVYHVKVSAFGYEALEEDIDLETLNGYVERSKDYNLYSKPFVANNPWDVKPQTEKKYKPSDEEIAFFNPKPIRSTTATPVAINTATAYVALNTATVAPEAPKKYVSPSTPKEVKKEEPKKIPPPIEPVVAKTEPVVVKEQPKPEPVVIKEEPKPEPVVVKEEPKPEPVVVKEEPKPEPVVVKEEPEPEPVVVKEEPKPEPVVVKEEPKKVEPKPEPVVVKTEPKKIEPKVEPVVVMEPQEEPVVKNEPKEEPKPEPVVKPEIKKTAEPCSAPIAALTSIKGRSLNDPAVYKQMLKLCGDYCAQNVVFKVQIGAYRKPDNYKYKKVKHLGKVEKEAYPDGITRFTQNEFSTIRQAEAHRQKAIANGQKDSWIVVFANGTRYTLEDFIMADFLGKAIN